MGTAEIQGERAPGRFRVADWEVDPAGDQIRQGAITRKLEPRVMELLVVLAQRPGDVLSREELEARVWAGRVVGYDALSSAIIKLRKVLGDDPHRPRYIETISKKGYRLIAPIDFSQAAQTEKDSLANASRKPSHKFGTTSARLILAGVFLFLLSVTFLSIFWESIYQGPVTQQPASTIAVLPFENLNDDKMQDYFSDGITDDLITDLSKVSNLLVISRSSSFFYKDKKFDPKEVAGKLNVRYILHGSVRRSGKDIRINAQLVDVEAGGHLWAERYDGNQDNIFQLQDSILKNIVSALKIELNQAEQGYLTKYVPSNADAYDEFLRGQSHFLLYANKEENNKARNFFLSAIDLDPGFAKAYAMLAWTYWFEFANGWSDNPELSLRQAGELAGRAKSINKYTPVAYFITGLVHREKKEYVKALVEVEKAIAIDANYANAHVLMATLLYYAGRPQEGLEKMKKAIRLNPHHPHNYPFHLGQAYFVLQRYDEAAAEFGKGIASHPGSVRLHIWLAAAFAHAGKEEEAKWEADQVLMLDPEFSLQKVRRVYPFKKPADLERLLAGLRKSGLNR
jgi:TolB-like protein/DNA-binding winged helix-turn-helix (wHTH) protein/Tfp pilus assembly protein PilF